MRPLFLFFMSSIPQCALCLLAVWGNIYSLDLISITDTLLMLTKETYAMLILRCNLLRSLFDLSKWVPTRNILFFPACSIPMAVLFVLSDFHITRPIHLHLHQFFFEEKEIKDTLENVNICLNFYLSFYTNYKKL